MGSLPGVVSTHAAWIDELEVVEVEYRPGELAFEELLEHAIEHSCDRKVFATTDAQLAQARARIGDRAARLGVDPRAAKAGDQLYYLGRSHLRHVPLTPLQARRVNGALGADGDAAALLSPRQRGLAERVQAALVKDARALDGLERPTDLEQLDEYQAALLGRLPGAQR